MEKGKQACIKFLERNGFLKMELNSYANSTCNIVFDDSDVMTVAENDGSHFFMNANIYTLIGWLTYYRHISRNYNV